MALARPLLRVRRATQSRAPPRTRRRRRTLRRDRERRQIRLRQSPGGIMKITIDATSALLRSAGIKNYTYHWIAHLRRQAAAGEEIAAYPFLQDFGQLDHEASALSFPATAARIALLHAVNWLGPAALDAVTSGSNVFHASNQVHHAPRRARLTATVHDLDRASV